MIVSSNAAPSHNLSKVHSFIRRAGAVRFWIAGVVVVAAGTAALAAEIRYPGVSRKTDTQPESNRRMAQRLVGLEEKIDPVEIPFFAARAAAYYRTKLEEARRSNSGEVGQLLLSYALSLLNDGQSEAALRELAKLEEMLLELNQVPTPERLAQLLEFKALAYLRLGEQENCLENHNQDSCLLPIQGGGVHRTQRGSRAAIAVLNDVLEIRPSPYSAWLLNIAYMTLGEYPQRVPSSWLIPPSAFASDYDIKRFYDVAGMLGLDVEDMSGGVVMDDFDGDGFLDLMTSASGLQSPLRFFRNPGDGTFVELTDSAGLTGLVGGLNIVQGDYNNDGLSDVLVLRGGWLGKDGKHPNSLLRNNGDNTFTDVTEEAGLLSFHSTQTAVWFDYNGDGWLDIFIGNETVPDSGVTAPCELYRNNGDGTFTECAAENGLAFTDWVKGVTAGDYNNDGRPDLYISSLVGPNRLMRNDGLVDPSAGVKAPHRFTDVAASAGVEQPLRSFPCWFFDFDNDGWLDLFVTGYSIRNAGDIAADYLGIPTKAEAPRLYRNNGDGTFRDVTSAAGLPRILHAMGANFGDLDNDGWLDFYVGTGDPSLGTLIPNRMFRNDGAGKFQDVTTSGGFGQLQKGHGIAFGDLNNDGTQDIYSVVGGAMSGDRYWNQLFANPGHGNHWLKLKLEGVESNRVAIGARVKVVVAAGERERAIHRVVTSGGSFGASPLEVQVGLGRADQVVRVEIVWPKTGKTQTIGGLALDRRYLIKEGSDEPFELPSTKFEWPTSPSGSAGGHHHHHHAGH